MTSLPLAVLGFLTVIIMLVLIMTKKASPLVALIAVPVVTGIIACFFMTGEDTAGMGTMERFTTNFKGLGEMITGSSGIGSVSSTQSLCAMASGFGIGYRKSLVSPI